MTSVDAALPHTTGWDVPTEPLTIIVAGPAGPVVTG